MNERASSQRHIATASAAGDRDKPDWSLLPVEGPADLAERFAALVVLVLAAIPAAVTALILLLELGRPILFRQTRSGLAGRPFTVVKFRTMHTVADRDGQLLPDDQRLTAITRFIRVLRLDEIPQLLAIASGEMSFVGPRPLRPETLAEYEILARIRSQVRPGLTGWAQVNGNTLLSAEDKLALDVWYVDHRSVLLNLRIFLGTIVTLFTGERLNPRQIVRARAHVRHRFENEIPGGEK